MTTRSAPSGTGAPVKMRTASPRPDAPAETGARERLSGNLQRDGNSGNVGGAHGIAVHRRGIEGRLRQPRRDVLGKDAAIGFVERHALGLERRKIARDAGESFGNGEKSHRP